MEDKVDIKKIIQAIGWPRDEEVDLESVLEEPNYIMDITVDGGQAPVRIDKFIMTRMQYGTRTKIQKAIDEEIVFVNGKVTKANYKIRPYDRIQVLDTRDESETYLKPEDCLPPIIYEDRDVLIVNKPAGMVVHPGNGNRSGTLLNGLALHFEQHKEEYTLPRFGLLHRIDKNTSGLLIIAKTVRALRKIQDQFLKHTIDRKYYALVWGDIKDDSGTINAKIGRSPRRRTMMTTVDDRENGKDAVTHYKVLERFGYVTLVECELETGRTHQIRVHMKHIGHPLFNDATYGGNRILKGTVYSKYKQFVDNCFEIMPRQALHAKTLGFLHPGSKERVLFETELPEDFQKVLEKWRGYVKAKGIDFEDQN